MDTTPRHGDSDNILLKKIAASVDGGGSGGGGGSASDVFLPPIGSITAFLRNQVGVPALPTSWVGCDGQVLSDAESPLNGQTIPDLNGTLGGAQRFLRGAHDSGAVGGADGLSGGTEVEVDNDHIASTTTVTGSVSDLPILPSFFEVYWIIRVK